MANTTTSLPQPFLVDVLPNIGTAVDAHKVWCRDNSKIQGTDPFTEIINADYDVNILDKITVKNPIHSTPSNMDEIYKKEFPTLTIKELYKHV